jgi:hypothetical protein
MHVNFPHAAGLIASCSSRLSLSLLSPIFCHGNAFSSFRPKYDRDPLFGFSRSFHHPEAKNTVFFPAQSLFL